MTYDFYFKWEYLAWFHNPIIQYNDNIFQNKNCLDLFYNINEYQIEYSNNILLEHRKGFKEKDNFYFHLDRYKDIIYCLSMLNNMLKTNNFII